MTKLAYLQAQWQEENHITEEGRRAAIRYERKLAKRREERKCYILAALLVVIMAIGCCIA